MVVASGPLGDLVPIENAAMPDRTVIQWNKDDLDLLGILKVDCLSLGMLTAIRKCLELVNAGGRKSEVGGRRSETGGRVAGAGPKGSPGGADGKASPPRSAALIP